jgi:hypothetical protein
MSYPRDILDAAHKHSSNHRHEIERSAICGCFYCCKTFASAEVEEWWDDGDTAECPYCGIDAVIGSASDYPVGDQPFLEAMQKRWFS